MKMGEYISRRKGLFIITIILIIVVILLSIFTLLNKNKDRDKVQEQDLKITYNLENNNPMDRETGISDGKYSSIVIKNNKNYKQEYKVVVNQKDNSTLELSKVYIEYNNEVKLLSDYTDGIITTGSINSNEEQTIKFKVWIGKELIVEPDDNEKVLSLKYEVIKK